VDGFWPSSSFARIDSIAVSKLKSLPIALLQVARILQIKSSFPIRASNIKVQKLLSQRPPHVDVPVFPACGFSPCSMALLGAVWQISLVFCGASFSCNLFT
jgi:hypothetical protein